jgi:hypothetical protein
MINGVILDGIMSIKDSDTFKNQFRTLNDRFYLYLSKCQQDLRCSDAFSRVTESSLDIISVTLRFQMLFLMNQTNPLCTTNLGLNNWNLFLLIANQGIENVVVRPLTIILIARIYRCSIEDQRVLSRSIPLMIILAQQATSSHFVDPPGDYPNDGSVLSITTIWSDFIGFTFDENFKTNSSFYNDLCVNSGVTNEYYLSPTGILPLCNQTKLSKYNYTLPSVFKDVLYSKNPRYWGRFEVNPRIFRSQRGGALLFNGDLDYNSPLTTAQQVQKLFEIQEIPTRLVEMKGLTHVTGIQSFTKQGGFQAATCTGQIILQFLYQEELNLHLSNLNVTCSSKENLIGIDWFYSDPTVNQTLHALFANLTYDYWGLNTTTKLMANHSSVLNMNLFMIFFSFLFLLKSTGKI